MKSFRNESPLQSSLLQTSRRGLVVDSYNGSTPLRIVSSAKKNALSNSSRAREFVVEFDANLKRGIKKQKKKVRNTECTHNRYVHVTRRKIVDVCWTRASYCCKSRAGLVGFIFARIFPRLFPVVVPRIPLPRRARIASPPTPQRLHWFWFFSRKRVFRGRPGDEPTGRESSAFVFCRRVPINAWPVRARVRNIVLSGMRDVRIDIYRAMVSFARFGYVSENEETVQGGRWNARRRAGLLFIGTASGRANAIGAEYNLIYLLFSRAT